MTPVARFIVVSAERVERSRARLAVLATYGAIPAEHDLDIVVNAPIPVGELHVIDRVRLTEDARRG